MRRILDLLKKWRLISHCFRFAFKENYLLNHWTDKEITKDNRIENIILLGYGDTNTREINK